MHKTYCVIGAGTYGCYLAACLADKFPDATILLLEVGDKTIVSEKEIGFLSRLTHNKYHAATDGRFFGFGGTSAKWGGQLLFFGPLDFADCPEMEAVVACNEQYKSKVLGRFFKKPPVQQDVMLNGGQFLKQGIWLNFRKRNLYDHFQINQKRNVRVIPHTRVVRINASGSAVASVTIKEQGRDKELQADLYYLTVGALESSRLLHVSGLYPLETNSTGFSDHVSLRCFEILTTKTHVGPVDFRFRFQDGSMLTSRIGGEVDNVSYYIHPIFNESFVLFQLLKEIIFKRQFSALKLVAAIRQLTSFFPFVYHYFIKKNLFVYKSWFLNIDVELANSSNSLHLSEEVDKYGEKGIRIQYEVNEDTRVLLQKVKEKVRAFLTEHKVPFKEMNDNVLTAKMEDVYHPYALYAYDNGKTIYEVSNPATNLYLFNTGLLMRAGSINPTASLFCLIEQHVENME